MNILRIPLLLALGLSLTAAACASPRTEAALEAKTPADQFPFVVKAEADETALAVHAAGVSPSQAAAIGEALGRWRETGGEVIVVRTPAGAVQELDATAMGEQVRSLLLAAGAPYDKVRVERYNAVGDSTAPLVIGFAHYAADIPQCGKTWDNLTATQSNAVHSNFGCAISANMAAQVADPRDLVQARASDPYEASRSTEQAGKYRRGEDTSVTVPKGTGPLVSRAIN